VATLATRLHTVVSAPSFHPPHDEAGVPAKIIVAAIVGHLALGILVEMSEAVAYVHMLGTIVFGFAWVLYHRRPERAAYVVAYFTGSEVLWRMAKVSLLWEFGKYGSVAVMLIGLAFVVRRRPHIQSAVYFGLLLPSAVITYWQLGFTDGRQTLSFNLSGPLALAVAAWFFSNVEVTAERLRRLYLFVAIPGIAVGGATLYAMLTAKNLHFSNNSNMETSAGYGPNQVSAILGLASLMLVFYLIQGSTPIFLRASLFGSVVFLAVQSALTFSRGGLVDSALALVVGALFLIRSRKFSARFVPFLLIGTLAALVVLPRLDSFTGGALGKRFGNPNMTHRDEMIKVEMQIWSERPIFGTGVGLARVARYQATHSSGVAHTEFSRLLAEHGSFGLASLILLIAMPTARLFAAKDPLPQALIAWCCCWSFAFMAFNAMRLMAPAFIYGLAFVNWAPARMFRLRAIPSAQVVSRPRT
jgi:O-antigen ligase